MCISNERLNNIAERIGRLLEAKGLSISVAESCTGGLLGSTITDIPGSSSYFLGGFITYSDLSKQNLLKVPAAILASKGAVSEEVAIAMAEGARSLLGTDIALSVTGIAGPTGGTREKPVGLVYVCLASSDTRYCEKHVWTGTRIENKKESVEAALILLERFVLSSSK